MAKRKAKAAPNTPPVNSPFDTSKFELIQQVGGILTGTIDHPQPSGGQACRVAHVDTGSGLRFIVNLDRGGDIVHASFNQHNLAYLTPNGYKPPNPAYHTGEDWLDGWPGGLVTACGPRYIGGPRVEDGQTTSLHGSHSNTPAALEMCLNPDPHRGRSEMLLSMVIRDSRFYGPTVEVRRQIQCHLGQPRIHLYDTVINRGDQTVPHNWLYHINLGYPLVDEGTRFIYRGKVHVWQPENARHTKASLTRLKKVPAPRADRAGGTSDVIFIDDDRTDGDGLRHVGVINRRLKLGFEITYRLDSLPRLGNWQHFGPRGAYVTGIEPFYGSLMGKDSDYLPDAGRYLEPGQSRTYHLTLSVLTTPQQFKALEAFDGPITLR